MPKWGKRVPVPRLHKASGQARIKVDGREVWLGKFGSAEARRRYAEFLAKRTAELAAGPTMEPERPATVSVAILRFWKWAEAHYRHPDGTPTREADNIRDALRPLRRMFGDLPLGEFGPAKLRAVRDAMVESGISRRTVNARIGRIRRFVRWCVGMELASPALAAVEPLRAGRGVRESPGRRPVAWALVESTLPHLPPMLAALVRVLWFTGARVGELATLTTGAIAQSDPTAWRATLDKHKNSHRGQGRTLILGPEAIEAIRPWLRPFEPDEPVFSPRRVDGRQARRLDGKRAPGRSYGRASLAQALRRAIERAGVEPWTLPQLRHSRATDLRERFGIDVAAAVLGHARPNMTAHYSREAIGHAVRAMREVG
jgi:integrase